MLRSKFDVTHLIKRSGKNAVAVLITDPDQKKTRKGKDPYGVACSPSYLAGAGWDWCRMCRDVLPELQEMLIWLLQVML